MTLCYTIVFDLAQCAERLHVGSGQIFASSGNGADAVLSEDKPEQIWQADAGDQSETVTIDLGRDMDVTGLVLKTTTIQKLHIQSSRDGVRFTDRLVSEIL